MRIANQGRFVRMGVLLMIVSVSMAGLAVGSGSAWRSPGSAEPPPAGGPGGPGGLMGSAVAGVTGPVGPGRHGGTSGAGSTGSGDGFSAGPTQARTARALPANVEFVAEKGPIRQYRLKSNGMDILMVPSDAAPVVTFLVVVRVGSRNESPGNTGSAHLLEHLLFNKSTENYGKKSRGGKTIQEVLYEAGGDFSTSNMTTWCDRITMYDTLPAGQLETTMKINADRLRRGRLLEEERRTEMTVVRNEYERGENDPSDALLKALVGAAVVAHPYHWSTIGYKSDIESVTIEKLREHYDTYFWPDNSTAVLLGDFDPESALAMFDRHFGAFPRAPKPIPKVTTVEPPQEGERRVVVRRSGATPLVSLAWMRPGASDPSFHAFDVMASILGDGVSARLYQSLVEKRLASSVSAWNWAFADPFLLILNATVSEGSDPAAVEAEMRAAVRAIRDRGVSEDEVARAKAQIEAQTAFAREGTYGTAWTLGEAVAARDWQWWVDYPARIRAVTPAEVREVAIRFLGPDQVTVGWFLPKKDDAAGEARAAGSPFLGPGPKAGAGQEAMLPAVAIHAPRSGALAEGGSARLGGSGSSAGGPLQATGGGAPRGFAERTRRRVLENGVVLLLLPNELSDTVSVRMRLRAGRYLEGKTPMLSSVTAEMLERGTRKRNKLEIARQLESAGSSRSWTAETYDVVAAGACLSKELPALLRTLVEELREPVFDTAELAKVKSETKVAILEEEENTTRRAFDELSRSVYPVGHPLRAWTARERLDSLDALSAEALRGFHASTYGAGTLVVALSGGFDPDAVERELTGLLGSLAKGRAVPVEAPRGAPGMPRRVSVPMKDKANVDILIGCAGGLRRSDPDYYAATLANAVLGQSGLSSRLGRQVRDTEGLTYTIVSRFFSPWLLDGPWGIYLSVAPPNVERGIASSTEVLRRLLEGGITEEELRVEKSAAAGRFQVALANNAGIADALAQAESYGLGIRLLDDFPRKVREVTLEDANKALRAHLRADALVIVTAGSLPSQP